jgi:DNA (cytosine-5)-methyltransferase 1
MFTALDLFAGCGGLALGFEAAGIKTIGYEADADAVATYERNLSGECNQAWLEVGTPFGVKPDIVIGGPPCQPFSVIGHQRGPKDERNGFPAFLDAVRRLEPKLALIENVRGMLYQNRAYMTVVMEELTTLGYAVDVRLLKATDYGVPQNRERVVIIATKVGWEWPAATVTVPVTAGIALGPTATEAPEGSKFLTASQDAYIAVYEKKSKCVRPRDLYLDRPARTLTCRNFGASTSDMHRIRLPDGRRRMLRIQEGARLQSFPDWFEFAGGYSSATKQIGNAVPPLMALALAKAARAALEAPGENGSFRKARGQLEFAF